MKVEMSKGLLKKFDRFKKDGMRHLSRLAVTALADITVTEIKSQTPVYTGRLRHGWSRFPSRRHATMRLGALRLAGRTPSARAVGRGLSLGAMDSNYHVRYGASRSKIRLENRTPYVDKVDKRYGRYHKSSVRKGMAMTRPHYRAMVRASLRKSGWSV